MGQRPSDPALLVPQQAPELDMTPVLDPLPIPAGMTMGHPRRWRSTPRDTSTC